MRFSQISRLLFICCLLLEDVDLIINTTVWSTSFETNEINSWNVTSNNNQFQRVLYANINSTVTAQDGSWAISANGINNELLLPPVAYYGGRITVSFYTYALQSYILAVRFLKTNLELVQEFNVSIISNGWNQYFVNQNNFPYPTFLVSFIYSGNNSTYLDSLSISIDGSIISCLSINSSSRCGFSTAVSASSGWYFSAANLNWGTSPAFTYIKRDFLYLGGLPQVSMNIAPLYTGFIARLEITAGQTSYTKELYSGKTSFPLTAFAIFTVGQTYTILITSTTPTIAAKLRSLSLDVAGNCSECNPVLTCNQFTNGVTCVCKKNSCPGSNIQCNVSTFDQSINPCSCLPGYIINSSGRCVDINECRSLNPPCSWSNGLCRNTNGSYLCTCRNGWMMGQDNASCLDINECNSWNPPCLWSNGVCNNTKGKYLCTCVSGWMMGQDNVSCVDTDECSSLNAPCSWSNGICTNTNGSYLCTCMNGWRMSQDNASCDDINECSSLNPPCSWNNGVCNNSNGSYLCTCMNGWAMSQNNASCDDINECSSLNPPCSWRNGICINTNGSYLCTCMNGWEMSQNNASCDDIDECSSLNPPCSWSNGICTNTNGSYLCTCMNGWTMSQYNASCEDIDECSSLNPPCSWCNGVCINTIGSYLCTCMNGWVIGKDNASCDDIDECDPCNLKSPCSQKVPCFQERPCSWNNGVCVNTIGSYSCLCNNGWVLGDDGASCVVLSQKTYECSIDYNGFSKDLISITQKKLLSIKNSKKLYLLYPGNKQQLVTRVFPNTNGRIMGLLEAMCNDKIIQRKCSFFLYEVNLIICK